MPVRTNNSYDIPSSYFEQQTYLQRRAELEKRFSVGGFLSDLGSAAETGLDTVTGGVQNLAQDTNTFFTETVPGKTGEALQDVSNTFYSGANRFGDGVSSIFSNGLKTVGGILKVGYQDFAGIIGGYISQLPAGPQTYTVDHVYPFDARPGENTPTPFGRPGFHIPGFPQGYPRTSGLGDARNGGVGGGAYIDAYCLQCSLTGNALVTGTFVIDLLAVKVDKISFDINFSGSVRLEIGLELIGSLSYNFTQPFVSVGLPGLSVPNIFTVGPNILGEVGIAAYTAASIQVSSGVILNFGNSRVSLDAQNIQNSNGAQYQPAVQLIPPAVSGQGRLTLNPFARVSLQLGIVALGGKLEAAAGVAIQVGVGFEINGRYGDSIDGLAENGQCLLDNIPPTLAKISSGAQSIISPLKDITKPQITFPGGVLFTGNGADDIGRLFRRDLSDVAGNVASYEPHARRKAAKEPAPPQIPVPTLSLKNPQATGIASSPIDSSDYCSNGVQLSTFLEVTVYAYAAIDFVSEANLIKVLRFLNKYLAPQQFTLWDYIYPIAAQCIQLPASLSTTLCDTATSATVQTQLTPAPIVRNRRIANSPAVPTSTSASSSSSASGTASGSSTGSATATAASSSSVSSSVSSTPSSAAPSSSDGSVPSSASATQGGTSAGSSSLSTSVTSPAATLSSLGTSVTSPTILSSSLSTSVTSPIVVTSPSISSSASSSTNNGGGGLGSECTSTPGGTPATIAPTASPTVTYEYVGCYQDQNQEAEGAINGVEIPRQGLGYGYALTDCVNMCANNGRAVALYHNGSCFCSSTVIAGKNVQKLADSQCNGGCDYICGVLYCNSPGAIIYEVSDVI